jgi:hypothetical protein
MKKYASLVTLLVILFSLQGFCQSGKGQICFIRPGGYTASAVPFRVFIDDGLVCKLKSKNYSTHTVNVGNHTVSGQNTGLTLDKGSKPFTVKVAEGKITYISVVWVSNKVMCQEITENSAMEELKKSKPASNCSDKVTGQPR